MKKSYQIKKSILMSLLMLFATVQLLAYQRDTITLDLTAPSYPSMFVFTDNGYWNQTFNDADYPFFTSQIFSFSHLIEGVGSSYGGYAWNGFTVCNNGDNTNHTAQGWNNYQWGNMAGGGIMTDAQGNIMTDNNGEVMVQQGLPYLVAYWNYLIEPEWWHLGWGGFFLDEPTRSLQVLLDDDEYEAVGVYVNIHPWAYYANLYGDGFARPLNQEGDFYKLIIHGLNADGTENGRSVEHIFAKFENGQLIQSVKWDWVDLSSLGVIGGFYCTMVTSDGSSMGPNSPMYFCMDKLQVRTNFVGVNEDEPNKIHIYSYQNTVYIKNVGAEHAMSQQTVEILDMTGRLVYRGVINDKEAAITLQVSEGIYNVVLHDREVARPISTKILITKF